MSYRKKHIKSSVRKIKPKRSILRNRWFWFGVLVLIIVLTAGYFLFFYSGVQVKDIVISGNQKITNENIVNLVLGNINSKFSRSIFLVNSDDLEKKLLDKFPEIKNIKVSKEFFHTITVSVAERAPVAVFCPLTGKIGCYFMDADGIIFESADEFPQDIVVVRQVAGTGQVSGGSNVIDKNIIDSILKIEKNLKDNFQINLKEALVKSLVRLDVDTSENWEIYFDTSSDIDLQITKLNLLLSSEISDEKRNNLRYINLIPKSKAIICDNPTCGG